MKSLLMFSLSCFFCLKALSCVGQGSLIKLEGSDLSIEAPAQSEIIFEGKKSKPQILSAKHKVSDKELKLLVKEEVTRYIDERNIFERMTSHLPKGRHVIEKNQISLHLNPHDYESLPISAILELKEDAEALKIEINFHGPIMRGCGGKVEVKKIP